jgi:putative redox protein
MTVQWAASEHQIPLSRVDVQVTQSRTREGHLFRRSVTLSGPLNDEQRGVLERAAEACPLARTLGGRFKIETRIAQG